MFRTLLADACSYFDLVNAVATGITRFARVTMQTNVLTLPEKVCECRRLTGLYRSTVWRRVVDGTDEAGELAVLLCCVGPECGREWNVAHRIQQHYIYN